MKNLVYALLATALGLASCNPEAQAPKGQAPRAFTPDNLATQTFLIQAEKDTVLKGSSGTLLFVPGNSFADLNGAPAKGPISLQLKEAISTLDIVLANLTTTSNGSFLQSGGMVCLEASNANGALAMATGMYIGMAIPADTVLPAMMVFSGASDSIGIDWQSPRPLLNEALAQPEPPIAVAMETVGEADPRMTLDSIVDNDPATGNGRKRPRSPKEQKALLDQMDEENRRFLQFLKDNKFNDFKVDANTDYLFAVKQLGWANIDRIMDDPRTQPVDLLTVIENNQDFGLVYVAMVMDYRKIYLPGYQKKDGTFSFTHGDHEQTSLPVGETAIIIATAYQGDKPFFAMKKTSIKTKQTLTLRLSATTPDQLKEELRAAL